MKTTKSLTFMQFLGLLKCFALCMLPVLLTAQANQKQYKFTNKAIASQPASDLHIKFDRNITFIQGADGDVTIQHPPGHFREGSGSGTQSINLARGLGQGAGAVVAYDACIVLTFSFDETVPNVTQWWWTDDNNLDPSSGILGVQNFNRCAVFEFLSVDPSTGDGSIVLNIDDESHTFEIPPNISSTELAMAFQSWVEDQFEFGDALLAGEAKVEVSSRAHSNEIDDILVTIFPDSTMEIEWTYIPEVIPTLSEWGVIILILLTLAVGMVFLYRRQTALALAGNIQVGTSASKPKLFDKRLYAKVFGVVLLAGFALLGLSYLYFGEITSADPLGTFVSSAIVAYMVHFWMLRKMQTE